MAIMPEDYLKPKVVLLQEILKRVGYGKEKSRYSDGQINKREMFAIHQYLIRGAGVTGMDKEGNQE